MAGAFVALALSPLGKEAAKVVAGLALALMLALAFTISSVAALLGGLTPGMSGSPASVFGMSDSAFLSSFSAFASSAGDSAVVEVARSQIGRAYVWGGASPTTSFDCSGLVQWAYSQLGVNLPRTAQQQFNATARIAPSDLQPGDLVFFHTYASFEPITHVGIYVGGGHMIDAPDVGAFIREESIVSPYWSAHYVGAGRVVR